MRWIVLAAFFSLHLLAAGLHADVYHPAGEPTAAVGQSGAVRFYLPPTDVTEPEFTPEEQARGYTVYSDTYMRTFWHNQVPKRSQIPSELTCRLAQDEYEPIQVGVYAHKSGQAIEKASVDVQIDLPYEVRWLDYEARKATLKGLPELGQIDVPFRLWAGNTIEKIEPGLTGTFWITFHAAKGAKPGVHEGQVKVDVPGKPSVTLPLKVEVLPFVLPKADIPFGMYYYKEGNNWPGGDYTPGIRDQVAHGMNSGTFYVFNQGDYPSLVRNAQYPRGKLLFPENSVEELRQRWTLGMGPADIPSAMLDYKLLASPSGFVKDPLNDRDKALYADLLAEFTRSNGFSELMAYLRDEPSMDQPATYVTWATGWKKSPMRTVAAMSGQAAAAWGYLHDVWIVGSGQITPEMQREARRQGAEVWNYCFSLGRWYNTMSSRYNSGLYTWGLGLTGNYQWSYDNNQGDRFVQVEGGVITPYISWEGRREGVDDYRYLRLLESLIADAGKGNKIASEARAWLDSLRASTDRVFFHGMGSGERYAGAYLYPAPRLEIDDYDRIRDKATSYIQRLGVESRKDVSIITPRANPRAGHPKWEAAAFEGKPLAACIAGLKSEDVQTRRNAATALALRGPKAVLAVPQLTALLKDQDVRLVAMRALGAIGPGAAIAVKPLTQALADRDVYVRTVATLALGGIGKPALPGLGVALGDKSNEIALVAGFAVSKLGKDALPVLPQLIRNLRSEDSDVQRGALEAIKGIGPDAEPAVPQIVRIYESLKGNDAYTQEALAAIGPRAKAAIPALEKYRAGNRYMAQMSDFALFRITGDNKYLDSIVDNMLGRQKYSPEYGARLLDELGASAKSVAPRIRKILEEGDPILIGGANGDHLRSFIEKVEKAKGK